MVDGQGEEARRAFEERGEGGRRAFEAATACCPVTIVSWVNDDARGRPGRPGRPANYNEYLGFALDHCVEPGLCEAAERAFLQEALKDPLLGSPRRTISCSPTAGRSASMHATTTTSPPKRSPATSVTCPSKHRTSSPRPARSSAATSTPRSTTRPRDAARLGPSAAGREGERSAAPWVSGTRTGRWATL